MMGRITVKFAGQKYPYDDGCIGGTLRFLGLSQEEKREKYKNRAREWKKELHMSTYLVMDQPPELVR